MASPSSFSPSKIGVGVGVDVVNPPFHIKYGLYMPDLHFRGVARLWFLRQALSVSRYLFFDSHLAEHQKSDRCPREYDRRGNTVWSEKWKSKNSIFFDLMSFFQHYSLGYVKIIHYISHAVDVSQSSLVVLYHPCFKGQTNAVQFGKRLPYTPKKVCHQISFVQALFSTNQAFPTILHFNHKCNVAE